MIGDRDPEKPADTSGVGISIKGRRKMMTYYMTETTAATVSAMEQKYGSVQGTAQTGSPAKRGFFASLASNIKSTFSDYRKRQLAKRELYGMTGRELSELGISRTQIDHIVDGPAKPSFVKRAFTAVREYISQRLKERAGYVHLMQMDQRQLEDLGLTRTYVERAATNQLPSAQNDNNPATIKNNDHRTAV